MGWTSRIPEFSPEPAEAVLQQGDRLLACFAAPGTAGIVRSQQLHQGRTDLFGSSAGRLMLERVPVTITDAEGPLQRHSALQRPIRPADAGRLVTDRFG